MTAKEIIKRPVGGAELWRWSRPSAVQRGDWPWPSFTPQEMACRGSHCVIIDPVFMDILQSMRASLEIPLPITSAYRSPQHNKSVSHTKALTGPHPDSQAVDIGVRFQDAYKVIAAAPAYGFTGIGIRQHGRPAGRFIHLDCWVSRKSPAVWTYDAT